MRGNNFWGVEMFRLNGKRYFAESDRFFGPCIFKSNPTRGDSGRSSGSSGKLPH